MNTFSYKWKMAGLLLSYRVKKDNMSSVLFHNSSVENVCDGEWHNVEVFLNLQVLVMKVDGGDYYVSDEKSDVNVFIEATENPMFGGIKPGSDAEKYIEEMNLSRLTRSKINIFLSRLNFFNHFSQAVLLGAISS